MNSNLVRGLRWGMVVFLVLAFLGALALLNYQNYLAGSTFWMLAASTVLLAVPLGLLFGSMALIGWVALGRLGGAAAGQIEQQSRIGPGTATFLYRAPRIAGVLMAVFISLFALDVFELPGTLWEQLLAFIIHAAPAIVLGVLLAVAWRWEWVGAVGFMLAALYFLRFALGGPSDFVGILLIFIGPLAAVALLWWVNWAWKKELHEGPVKV